MPELEEVVLDQLYDGDEIIVYLQNTTLRGRYKGVARGVKNGKSFWCIRVRIALGSTSLVRTRTIKRIEKVITC